MNKKNRLFSFIVMVLAMFVCLGMFSPAWAQPRNTSTATQIVLVETFLAPAAASATTFKSAATVNFTLAALIAGGTSFTLANSDYSDAIVPRNIVAVIASTTGVNATNFAGTLTITGYDSKGVYHTGSTAEVLQLSTVTVTGSVPFTKIERFDISVSTGQIDISTGKVGISIGTGVKIGLANGIGEASDVIKVLENGAVATTYTLDFINDTITFVAAPNGSDNKQVKYKVK